MSPVRLIPLLLVVGALGAADTTMGWRGDGTGYFPHATPPTEWGDGSNIAWKVETASFGDHVVLLIDTGMGGDKTLPTLAIKS